MCILLNVKKHEKTFTLNVDIFKAENKGEKHLTTAGYASIISRSVKVDKWKPKPRQPFSIDNDSHLRWNRGL